MHYVDRIEWDLSSPLTPEIFAAQLCVDLALSGECEPLIVHALHEELHRHKKDVLESGVLGRMVTVHAAIEQGRTEEATNQRGPKRMEGAFRDWAEVANFGPKVELVNLDAAAGDPFLTGGVASAAGTPGGDPYGFRPPEPPRKSVRSDRVCALTMQTPWSTLRQARRPACAKTKAIVIVQLRCTLSISDGGPVQPCAMMAGRRRQRSACSRKRCRPSWPSR